VPQENEVRPFFQPVKCEIGNKVLTCEFLYMPECLLLLTGRNLLNKLGAQITFNQNNVRVRSPQYNAWETQVYMLLELSEAKGAGNKEKQTEASSGITDAVIPFVWATKKPGRATWAEPVRVELKPGAKLLR